MKLFLDENIPRLAVNELKTLGFEVEHASEVGLKGANDRLIAEYAKKQMAILITKDLEFGSLIVYPKGTHYGLIVLRLPNYFTAENVVRVLKDFIKNVELHDLIGKMIVLELHKYRIRDIS